MLKCLYILTFVYKHFNISNGARFTCYGAQSLYTQTYKPESGLHVMVCPFSAMISDTDGQRISWNQWDIWWRRAKQQTWHWLAFAY